MREGEWPWKERACLLVRMKHKETPSRVTERGQRNVPLCSPVVSEVSLGRSIHYFSSSSPLRIINSLDLPISSSSNFKALQPSWMVVSSGKSIRHSPSWRFTLKDNTKTMTECTIAKQKWFQTGQVYSSFHSFRITLQFQWSTIETVTLFIHFSHFNHFQRRHILNLTYGIIRERITTNHQFFQSLTILQIEMTIRQY